MLPATTALSYILELQEKIKLMELQIAQMKPLATHAVQILSASPGQSTPPESSPNEARRRQTVAGKPSTAIGAPINASITAAKQELLLSRLRSSDGVPERGGSSSDLQDPDSLFLKSRKADPRNSTRSKLSALGAAEAKSKGLSTIESAKNMIDSGSDRESGDSNCNSTDALPIAKMRSFSFHQRSRPLSNIEMGRSGGQETQRSFSSNFSHFQATNALEETKKSSKGSEGSEMCRQAMAEDAVKQMGIPHHTDGGGGFYRPTIMQSPDHEPATDFKKSPRPSLTPSLMVSEHMDSSSGHFPEALITAMPALPGKEEAKDIHDILKFGEDKSARPSLSRTDDAKASLQSGTQSMRSSGFTRNIASSSVVGSPMKEGVQVIEEAQTPERQQSIERQNSKKFRRQSAISMARASALLEKATVAKYNSKGSLASADVTELESQTSQSKRSSFQPEPINFWKYGLNPFSSISVNLEFAMAVLYVSVLWIVPLEIGFETYAHWSYSVILSIAFTADIIIEFITFRKTHPSITALESPSLRDWQIYYLKHEFILDLLSAFPFEMLPIPDAEYLWAIRILRLHKLPRILAASPKFAAIRKYLETVLGIGKTFSGIFSLGFCLAVFLHWQACLLFLAGRLTDFSNSAIQFVQDKNLVDQYIWALFTATGNTFPVLYRPNTIIEQTMMIIFLITGAALYASIVGMLSAFAMGFDASGRLYKQKMDELKEYFRWKDLDDVTQRKIIKYYDVKYRGKFFEEETLLKDLNDPLRKEIALHNCKKMISNVKFLRRDVGDGRDELFIGRIALALKSCYYVTGDIIIHQGGVECRFFLFQILFEEC
ncbi:hypothetical protein HDU81_008822 [Chytriomyces hyalinus]|nr:hypothetical protein HDU81_008822 [Chytriomyces hyalinus]